MLAPEPFFEPRGTPFSEYHRLKALSELGYRVDLVTYPFGRDVTMPGLRIYRCSRPPFVRGVRIGPSAAKIVLDVTLAFTAARLAHAGRYDAVHSHEEAGLLGLVLAAWLDVPHLYDMHSSLPQQLRNFGYDRSGPDPAAVRARRDPDDHPVARHHHDLPGAAGHGSGARRRRPRVADRERDGRRPRRRRAGPEEELRARYGIGARQPVVLYTGTFEAYQGLDLLIEATATLGRTHPDARVLVVGGTPTQVARARRHAGSGASNLLFTGQRPATEIPGFVAACDILVSPRTSGTNTPLKIYSYLRSGRPIVATRLRTHTQVLDSETALLVPPRADALATGLARLIDDPDERTRLAEAAQALAASRYSRESYVARTAAAYERLLGRPAPLGGGSPPDPDRR